MRSLSAATPALTTFDANLFERFFAKVLRI
jgi:hypothetical protein